MARKNFDNKIINRVKAVLLTESEAIKNLSELVDEQFVAAVKLFLNCSGKVIITGIGKSGLIGKKISATLSSTGTPSSFLHAAEASHGDIGVLQDNDVVMAISNSGESDELLTFLPSVKRRKISLISLTANTQSTLASLADIVLHARFNQEACALGLAPTTSSTLALAVGDALAIATLEARGFQSEDFAKSHPAGTLGRQLVVSVQDVMRRDSMIPVVRPNDTVANAIIEMTKKGMGMTLIMENGYAVGIFTDGDLRRFLQDTTKSISENISIVMTKTPHTISKQKLAVHAAELMEEKLISQIIVIDEDTKHVEGVVNMHDLMQAKVI